MAAAFSFQENLFQRLHDNSFFYSKFQIFLMLLLCVSLTFINLLVLTLHSSHTFIIKLSWMANAWTLENVHKIQCVHLSEHITNGPLGLLPVFSAGLFQISILLIITIHTLSFVLSSNIFY